MHECVLAASLFSACQVFLKVIILSHFIHFGTYSKYTASCVHKDVGKGSHIYFPKLKETFSPSQIEPKHPFKIIF